MFGLRTKLLFPFGVLVLAWACTRSPSRPRVPWHRVFS
jgi:hypothetical protein